LLCHQVGLAGQGSRPQKRDYRIETPETASGVGLERGLVPSTGLVASAIEKALSTLATIVAEFGDNLLPNSASVAVFGDSRRFR